MVDSCFFIFRADVEHAAQVVAFAAFGFGMGGVFVASILRHVIQEIGARVRERPEGSGL